MILFLIKKVVFLLFYVVLIFKSINIANSETLNDTLAQAYTSSPLLKSHIVKLEALNEEVSKALSKKRPKVNLYGTIGTDETTTVSTSNVESTKRNDPKSITLEISQNIYDSGRTKYEIDKNESLIFAQRAETLNEEQKILLETTNTYLTLLANNEIYKLAKNNLQVLNQHFKATTKRFEVGEATSTELSLSEARYLRAKSDEIKAKGDIEIEKSKYFSIVGVEAPKSLSFPKNNLKLPTNIKIAMNEVLKSNPMIIANGLRKKSSFLEVAEVASNLLPTLDLNLSAQNAWAPNTFFDEYENYKMELSLKIPLYKGGYNYSEIRQKKKKAIQYSKNHDYIIKKVLNETETLWIERNSLEIQLKSIKATIKANELALDGVKKEAEVGARTVLDVLDSEQDVLEEKVEFIKVNRDKVYTSYAILAKLGRLNAKNLDLNVTVYDSNENYLKIKNLWLGFESP